MAEVEMVIDSLRQSPVNHQWVVVLKDKLAERYLPVYIGSSQADTIKRELTDISPLKPLARNLGCGGIDAVNSQVKAVKLDKFDDNVFSAKLVMAAPGKSHEVACPPAVIRRAEVRILARHYYLRLFLPCCSGKYLCQIPRATLTVISHRSFLTGGWFFPQIRNRLRRNKRATSFA